MADAVEALVKDHVDSIRRDALGNLICKKRGTDPDGKRIMLSAHMDHIALLWSPWKRRLPAGDACGRRGSGREPHPPRQLPNGVQA